MATVEERWAAEPYCYLTTVGRRTGRPHEIEIWFAAVGDTIYLMNDGGEDAAAGESDWAKNLRANPSARVRIGDETFAGEARPVEFDSPSTSGRASCSSRSTSGPTTTWRGGARRRFPSRSRCARYPPEADRTNIAPPESGPSSGPGAGG
ncbi:MAG: nitroreductase/quinone reductase family protein [Dehalococcoidia bacterium]